MVHGHGDDPAVTASNAAAEDSAGEGSTHAGPAPASSRARKQVLLRLDPQVHAALAKWAADDLRSVNAQIEVLLRRALRESGRGVAAAPIPKRGRPSLSETPDH